MAITHPLIGKLCQWKSEYYGKVIVAGWDKTHENYRIDDFLDDSNFKADDYTTPPFKWQHTAEKWHKTFDLSKKKYLVVPVECVKIGLMLNGRRLSVTPVKYLKCFVTENEEKIHAFWIKDEWLEEFTDTSYHQDFVEKIRKKVREGF